MSIEIQLRKQNGEDAFSFYLGELLPGITILPTLNIHVLEDTGYEDELRITAILANRSFQVEGDNDEGLEIMIEKWIEGKLPGGSWKPVGGDPTVPENCLSIARPALGESVDLELRINVPEEFDTIGDFSLSIELYYRIA